MHRLEMWILCLDDLKGRKEYKRKKGARERMNLNQPYYIEPREGMNHLSLDGKWQYGYQDEAEEQPASVLYEFEATMPDSLFWNLYESGVMPHPYEGLNSKKFHWVDEKVWYFRKKFTVEKELQGRNAILCFDGVSYYCKVWLNGNLIGEHEGMFGGPYVYVSQNLRYGEENELVVEVKACNYGQKETYDELNRCGTHREIVPWNIARDSHTSNGDWIIMGLWRSVRIEFLEAFHLGRPYLVTKKLEDGRALLRLETEIIAPELNELHPTWAIYENNANYTFAYTPGLRQAVKDIPATVRVRLVEKNSGECAFEKEYPIELLDYEKSLRGAKYQESQYFEKEFYLDQVKLWWPHDMGDPFLYQAEIMLIVDGKMSDKLTFDYGVRTIEMEQTPGPRTRIAWEKYQFIINGKKVFLKGVNWMPQDVLYREDAQEYEWTLGLVKNAGIHLVRVWSGGGTPECDAFYHTCDKLGLMVWQDHLIANTSHTESWPQEVLEAQESVNIFRIRNHPSLAVHCGGNEFNPYSAGNAASMFVIMRTLENLDPYRKFYYTTPVKGSAHIYNDMEPTWYRYLYKDLPFVGETGIHSLPNFKAMRRYLSEKECTEKLPELTTEEFRKEFPEFLNHFTEYVPTRVPRMLARASQIIDLTDTDLESIIEATQIASCEYYEILTQSLRENYPFTAGLIPWVFKRTWATAGIQLVDGTGEPVAPYYYLKNAYSNLEVHLALEQVSYAAGELVKVPVRVCNEYELSTEGYMVRIKAWSPEMKLFWEEVLPLEKADGAEFALQTEKEWSDKFFFFTITLEKGDQLILKQTYWPKCLSVLEDDQTLEKYRTSVQGNFRLENGPWLKPQVKNCEKTVLQAEICSMKRCGHRAVAEVKIVNTGDISAFPVSLQVTDLETRTMASDNWIWMEAGESRTLRMEVDVHDGIPETLNFTVSAWNADTVGFQA